MLEWSLAGTKAMTTKQLDSKGRLCLGKEFANRVVIVDDSDPTRIVVVPALVVPEHEAWLYKNPQVHAMVRQGIERARLGKFAATPPVVPAVKDDEPA